MQDRVSLYPGRVTLTPVSGQANTYDLARADSPTQEGTPLSKANLLKDTTAALFGLGSAAVPDDVFQKLGKKEAFEVGDTLTTVRTDLGDKWLLCNGEYVATEDYPLLKKFPSPPKIDYYGTISFDSNGSVAYGNGTWVAVGYMEANNTSSQYPYIFTATDPAGTWTGKQIGTVATYLTGITYGNGMWVVTGRRAVSGYNPCIFTATDPTGTWTEKQIDSKQYSIEDVAYGNGVWVAVGVNTNRYPYIYTTTDPEGTWTGQQISTKRSRLQRVEYADGVWVAVGNGDTNDTSASFIYTATDPTGTWTGRNAGPYTLGGVHYHNGVWVAVGVHDYTDTSRVFIATNPEGTWEEKYPDLGDIDWCGVTWSGGRWIIVGSTSSDSYARIYSAADPAGAWELVIDAGYYDELCGIDSDGEVWSVAGVKSHRLYVFTNAAVKLPTISTDGVYTYIKAKE